MATTPKRVSETGNFVDEEFKEKEARLWRFLEARGLEGVLISKRSNFAWITCGGDNHVFLASDVGAASLLIKRAGKYLLAHTMDGDRIMTEELSDQGIELKAYSWYEGRRKILEELTQGYRIGSDVPISGLEPIDRSWREIIFPLTPREVERAQELGRLADVAITSVCYQVQPGDTELDVAGMLGEAYLKRGMNIDVLLVGSDERLYNYRHCLPTSKRIKRHLLTHVAAQKWGLHANLTRLIHFGRIPEDLAHRHRAVSYVHATILADLEPGGRFIDLFHKIKSAYAESGFPDEWRGHFQGGPAAYEACEPYLLLDPEARIQMNETYDWLPTVPGTKTEELSLLTEAGASVISLGPGWPTHTFAIEGRTIAMPDILER